MKFDVLDKGYVELVDHMGSDLAVVNAARVSFGKSSTAFEEKDRKLLCYLLEHGHTSPLRHSHITFRVKAPIFVLRQWMRHRIASEFNEISGRYVELGDAEFYVPAVYRKQSASNKQGSAEDLAPADSIRAGVMVRCSQEGSQYSYKDLRNKGVAREQARVVMPLAMYSEVMWTVSLHAVLNFLDQRTDSHAQWEIRQYAAAVKEVVQQLFPEVMQQWELLKRKREVEHKLADVAVWLALTDAAYELAEGTTDAERVTQDLFARRNELRELVCNNLDLFQEALQVR